MNTNSPTFYADLGFSAIFWFFFILFVFTLVSCSINLYKEYKSGHTRNIIDDIPPMAGLVFITIIFGIFVWVTTSKVIA